MDLVVTNTQAHYFNRTLYQKLNKILTKETNSNAKTNAHADANTILLTIDVL
jgi:hypothetical protein